MSSQADLNLEKELFSACEAGDVERVRRVIAAGVDPKKAINRGLIRRFARETPLHTACRYVHALATKFVSTFI
jgi:ankyrin repeat protein